MIAEKLVKVDNKGRVQLGVELAGKWISVQKAQKGSFVLMPVKIIPEDPIAFDQVEKKQARKKSSKKLSVSGKGLQKGLSFKNWEEIRNLAYGDKS